MTWSYGWNPQRLQHLRTNKYKLVEFWLRYSEENKRWTLLDSQSVCECLHGEVVVVCTGGTPVCRCTHQGAALGWGWSLLSTPALLLCVQVAEMLLMTSAAVNAADQHASTPLHSPGGSTGPGVKSAVYTCLVVCTGGWDVVDDECRCQCGRPARQHTTAPCCQQGQHNAGQAAAVVPRQPQRTWFHRLHTAVSIRSASCRVSLSI